MIEKRLSQDEVIKHKPKVLLLNLSAFPPENKQVFRFKSGSPTAQADVQHSVLLVLLPNFEPRASHMEEKLPWGTAM